MYRLFTASISSMASNRPMTRRGHPGLLEKQNVTIAHCHVFPKGFCLAPKPGGVSSFNLGSVRVNVLGNEWIRDSTSQVKTYSVTVSSACIDRA